MSLLCSRAPGRASTFCSRAPGRASTALQLVLLGSLAGSSACHFSIDSIPIQVDIPRDGDDQEPDAGERGEMREDSGPIGVDAGSMDDDTSAKDAAANDAGAEAEPDASAFAGLRRISAPDASNDFGPQIAMTPAGDALVVFYGFGVWATRYTRASDSFSPITRLTEEGSPGVNPLVAIDDAGNAVVVWNSYSKRDLYARRFDASQDWASGWGPIELVRYGESTSQVTMFALDMTSDGHFVVAWSGWETVSGYRRAFLRVGESGQAPLSTPAMLSGEASASSLDSVAVVNLGGTLRVVCGWTRSVGTTSGLEARAALYDHSLAEHKGSLTSDTLVASDALATLVQMDAAGNAFAVARGRSTPYRDDGVLVRRLSGDSWSDLLSMSTPGQQIRGPVLSMAPTGEALIAWYGCESSCGIWSRYFADGVWQAKAQIPATAGIVDAPVIALRSGGSALAMWSASSAHIHSVYGSEFEPLQGWTSAEALESESDFHHGRAMDLAISAAGNGLGAWVREKGVGETTSIYGIVR